MQSFRDPDRRIGALATQQHGVVARRQLAELGLTPQHIAYRIDIGRLIRIFRGVYAVAVRAGPQPDRRRIRLHRVGTLTSDEVTVHDAIPVTTPARTLLDLASVLRPRALEDAIAQADHLERFDLVAVRQVLDAHPRQHGTPALRTLLDRLAGADVALCDDYGLPAPLTNVQIAGFTVDFHWPAIASRGSRTPS